MSKLFKNTVDVENGVIYGTRKKGILGSLSKDGYIGCGVKDKFGNLYYNIHQVIFAEAHNMPKHLWPVDEHGKSFEIDHINAVRTDNRIENLRLVSKKDNNKNPLTKDNLSKAIKGKMVGEKNPMFGKHLSDETKQKMSVAQINNEKLSKQVFQYSLDGNLIKIWPSTQECGRNGYNQGNVGECCRGMRKTHKGYRWSYEPL